MGSLPVSRWNRCIIYFLPQKGLWGPKIHRQLPPAIGCPLDSGSKSSLLRTQHVFWLEDIKYSSQKWVGSCLSAGITLIVQQFLHRVLGLPSTNQQIELSATFLFCCKRCIQQYWLGQVCGHRGPCTHRHSLGKTGMLTHTGLPLQSNRYIICFLPRDWKWIWLITWWSLGYLYLSHPP